VKKVLESSVSDQNIRCLVWLVSASWRWCWGN